MTNHLTSRQAAERARVTVTTINRWVASGRLRVDVQVPGYRGARLFTPNDVETASGREAATTHER